MKVTYDYTVSGCYSETKATLEDGRVVIVDCQYGVVLPLGKHAANCEQMTKMGGRCTCGMLDGIDVPALVADARKNGKKGSRPADPVPAEVLEKNRREMIEFDARRARAGLCPKCGTYCHGDCDA